MDAGFENRDFEIYKECKRLMNEAHVSQRLKTMKLDHAGHSLNFDDQRAGDKQVDTATCNDYTFVDDLNRLFSLARDLPKSQFVYQCILICSLGHAGTKLPMDLDCGADDLVREFIQGHRHDAEMIVHR